MLVAAFLLAVQQTDEDVTGGADTGEGESKL
jgi:hypothetical protein